jgi:hypothetical protein
MLDLFGIYAVLMVGLLLVYLLVSFLQKVAKKYPSHPFLTRFSKFNTWSVMGLFILIFLIGWGLLR